MLTHRDSIFDGFCHRPFNERSDGWMNEMPEVRNYPAVEQAQSVLDMWAEMRALRKENWELRQKVEENKGLYRAFPHLLEA